MGRFVPAKVKVRFTPKTDAKFSLKDLCGKFWYKFCRWLDSNCGPLVSEATTLPSEPRHWPPNWLLFLHFICLRQAVSPDDGIKSWTNFFQNCPKRTQIMFYIKVVLFKIAKILPEYLGSFCKKICHQKVQKFCPIWSHCQQGRPPPPDPRRKNRNPSRADDSFSRQFLE